MAYLHERLDGTIKVHPHKLRAMLRSKIADLLSRYSLDEVLGEIADQRPSFDIRLTAAGKIKTEESVERSA
jgi:hypothetical protein